MHISQETFRMAIIGFALMAASFQLFDHGKAIDRLFPEPNDKIFELKRVETKSVGERKLQEHELVHLKIQHLEAELNDKSELERILAGQQALQTKQLNAHEDLLKKIENLHADLKLGSKQESITADEPNKKREKQQAQREQSQLENSELLRPKSCSAVMQRMHDWNDCWRRHLMTSNGEPWKKNVTCLVSVESEGKTQLIPEQIGAPLYQFSFFVGQGFGRFVQYVNDVCMRAFLLKRPCLINKAPRDPNNNWGSFISEHTYHWDPSALHALPEYANQLEALAMKLPKMGLGSWGDAINETDYDKPESLVFPANKRFEKEGWGGSLLFYSGTNPLLGNKVLFAPNWGDALWIPFSDHFKRLHGCNAEKLASMMQNALFGPTDLTLQLHQERYERADATVWNPKNKEILYKLRKKTPAPVTGAMNPAVRTGPHLSITGTIEGIPSYGTIHLRTYFIKREMRVRGLPPWDTSDIADALTSCLERAKEIMGKSKFPENWWIISDNAPTALVVTKEFHKRGMETERQANSSLPVIKIFTDYKETAPGKEKVEAKDAMPSEHSLSHAAVGLYGHANMAGSIMDWIALHESDISIVTGQSEYGNSGSRGKGKSVAAFCGESGRSDNNRQMFKIFVHA